MVSTQLQLEKKRNFFHIIMSSIGDGDPILENHFISSLTAIDYFPMHEACSSKLEEVGSSPRNCQVGSRGQPDETFYVQQATRRVGAGSQERERGS